MPGPYQSLANLTELSGRYRPIAPGVADVRPNPFQGIPGFEGGSPTAWAGMLAMQPFQAMFGRVGMLPMGVNHDQNVYDRLMHQRFTINQMTAMREAAHADRAGFQESFRGLAALTGTPYGGAQQQAANTLADAAVSFSPFAAELMPDFLDRLGGRRGSATVFARRFMDAGRYRLDPVTGRMGLSAESVVAHTRELTAQLFSPGNVSDMRGFTLGQTGALAQELQSRGLLGTSASASPAPEANMRSQILRAVDDLARNQPERFRHTLERTGVNFAGGSAGLSAADVDKLNLDPNVAERLRSFDVSKIKRSLQAYAGAVAAMRDIFGDMGRPNAPMSELVAGLEALSGGSMASMSPGRLAMVARHTYNMATQTGVSMDQALMMQQHAMSRAGELGLEGIFGVRANQGAMAFGGAYRSQGHAAHTAWGAMGADQLQQLDAHLRLQAAGSNMANRMATAVRLARTAGGFDPNTNAGRFVQAIEQGQDRWIDQAGNPQSLLMTQPQLVAMLSGATRVGGASAGIRESDVHAVLGQQATNREDIERYGIQNVVRRAQGPDETTRLVGHRLQETLFDRVNDQIRDPVAARAVAIGVSQRAARRIQDMSTEDYNDNTRRNRGIANILQEEINRGGFQNVLQGMNPAQRQQFLEQTADRFHGHLDRWIANPSSGLAYYRNSVNWHALNNRTTLDEVDRQQMQTDFRSRMQDALSPLGHGSLLSRAVDAVQNLRDDDPQAMLRVVAQTLGGVRTDDINRALLPQFRRLQGHRAALATLQNRLLASRNPAEQAELRQQISNTYRELGAEVRELNINGEQFGLFSSDAARREDLQNAYQSSTRLLQSQNDLAGLRGNFGEGVSDRQLEDARKQFTGDDQARLRAREILGSNATPEQLRQAQTGTGTQASAMTLLGHAGRRFESLSLGERERVEQVMVGTNTIRATPTEALAVLTARRQRDVDFLAQGGEQANNASEDARRRLAAHMTAARAAQPGANDAQVRAAAINAMQREVTQIPPAAVLHEMRNLNLANNDEARALVRTRRRLIPGSAPQGAIDQIMQQYRGLTTEAEAAELANARLRARRLGVSDEEIRTRAGADRSPVAELRAINSLFNDRQTAMYEVTATQREEFVRAYRRRTGHDLPAATADELRAFRTSNPEFANSSDEAVQTERTNRVIIGERLRDQQRRTARFWQEGEGQEFRRQSGQRMQDVDSWATGVVGSPQMVQRYGTRALEAAQQTRADQGRLRELARYHTGGDMARLLNGVATDFTSVDMRTPAGRAEFTRARAEVLAIQQRAIDRMHEFQVLDGRPGRQFQLGDEDQATRHVLQEEVNRGVAQGGITQAQADDLYAHRPSPEMRERLERRAIELGSEGRAREIRGIPQDLRDLTDLQRGALSAIRLGTSNPNNEEAAAVYGRERWNQLTPAQRTDAAAELRRGTGLSAAGRARALTMLNFTEDQLTAVNDPTNERRQAVLWAQTGLDTDEHARQLARIELAPGATPTAAQAALTRSVRVGTGSITWAREHDTGSPDPLHRLQDRIRQAREASGDRAEAMRLLRLEHLQSPTDPTLAAANAVASGMMGGAGSMLAAAGQSQLSTEQERQVTQLAGEINLSRRSSTDDNRAQQAGQAAATFGSALTILSGGFGPALAAAAQTDATTSARQRVENLLRAQQREAATQMQRSPEQRLREVLNAYGFERRPETPLTGAEGTVAAQAFRGEPGAQFADRAIATLDTINRAVTRGTGRAATRADRDALVSSYLDASRLPPTEQAARLQRIIQENRFDLTTTRGREEWEQFREAVRFQANTGLRDFGAGRSGAGGNATEIGNIVDRFNTTQATTTMQGQIRFPDSFRLSGEVEIRRDESGEPTAIDFSAANGGSTAYPVVGGDH